MTGGRRVALVLKTENREKGMSADYHWYVYDEKSSHWYNKNGQYLATDKQLKITNKGVVL